MKIYIHHGGSLIQTQYRKDQDKICAKKITCPHWWGEHDEIIKTIAHFYFFLIWRKMTTMHAIEWEHNTKQMRWCEARKKKLRRINKQNRKSTLMIVRMQITCSIAGFVCGRTIDQSLAIGICGVRCDCGRGIGWCLWLQHNVFRLKILDGICKMVHFFIIDWWN